MVTPIFAVVEVRTAAELVNFSHPMPTVSAGLKRILDSPNCQAAARLMPVIAKIHGLSTLSVIDICYVGGGVLMMFMSTTTDLLGVACIVAAVAVQFIRRGPGDPAPGTRPA
jgi:hypothetical protein